MMIHHLSGFFAGTLHRLPTVRDRTIDRSIDGEIARVWAAFARGEISEAEVHRLDRELRRRQRSIVTAFRRPGALGWIPRFWA